jgi:hypothetical protein
MLFLSGFPSQPSGNKKLNVKLEQTQDEFNTLVMSVFPKLEGQQLSLLEIYKRDQNKNMRPIKPPHPKTWSPYSGIVFFQVRINYS